MSKQNHTRINPIAFLLILLASAACLYFLRYRLLIGNSRLNEISKLIAAGRGHFTILEIRSNSSALAVPIAGFLEKRASTSRQENFLTRQQSAGAQLAVAPRRSSLAARSGSETAFLVRTYNPTAHMSKHVAQWFSSLRSSPHVHTFLSIDQTKPGHEQELEALIQGLHDIGFDVGGAHRYLEDDMRRLYPGLEGKTDLAWGYHVQAVDLWLQTLPHKDQTYKHIWVAEDDLGYTGDMSDFLHHYDMNDADLVGGIEQKVESAKWWPDKPTELFKQRVPPGKRLSFQENIARFSAKLLRRLHEWSVAGAIDWSESMPCTVCHLEGMQCASLQADDVGDPYTWKPTQGVHDEGAWEALWKHDTYVGHPLLYHPLKF